MIRRHLHRNITTMALVLTAAGVAQAQTTLTPESRWPSQAPRAEWSLEWSPTFTQGNYGGDSTISSVQNSVRARWRQGAWRASIGAGQLWERDGIAPESVTSGGGNVPSSVFRAWDDVSISLGHVFRQKGRPLAVTVTGHLTLPTGSASMRVSRPQPQIDMGLRWRPNDDWSSTVSLGHRWVSAPGLDVRNTWHLRATTAWSITSEVSLDASYVQRKSRYPDEVDVREATVGFFVDASPTLGWGAYAIKGFGDNSPSRGVGTILTWTP